MKPTQHPSCNAVLGAPKGWDQQGPLPCSALAITRHELDDMPVISSFWRPSAAELAALNTGSMVMVTVVGNTHPPLLVQVTAE